MLLPLYVELRRPPHPAACPLAFIGRFGQSHDSRAPWSSGLVVDIQPDTVERKQLLLTGQYASCHRSRTHDRGTRLSHTQGFDSTLQSGAGYADDQTHETRRRRPKKKRTGMKGFLPSSSSSSFWQ